MTCRHSLIGPLTNCTLCHNPHLGSVWMLWYIRQNEQIILYHRSNRLKAVGELRILRTDQGVCNIPTMSGHPPSSLPPIIDSANPIFRTDSSILEFHPINDIAELAFDDLVTAYKAKEIKQHHAEHMVVTGERALSGSRINSGTESSSGDDSKVLAVGYFRIGFTAPTVAGVPMWAMGTSSTKRSASPECKAQRHTKVDVLIARHPYGKGLHREHAFLRIHPESGVWLLSISDHCKPLQSRLGGQPLNASLCQHRPMHLNGKLIRHSEELCLSQSEFTLQFANLSFRVIFKVAQGHQEDSYMKRRNAFLAEMGIPKPPSLISGIPFAHDHRNDLATWRNPYRHGASGVVHLGFDPNEGGLRAVKTWICKRATEASAVMNEIDVSLFLSEKKSEGIIRVFGWRNTAGEKVVRDPPMDYYLVMESGLSFKEIKWPLAQSVTPSEWHERKTLFYQILRGLETIHALKWIHRDVTASNIIYIPAIEAFRSASAKLADFGKLCQSSVHTDHHLAAEKFRAPEVDGQRTYDQRIDIWGLALAMAYCWFTHERPKMNKIEHAAILSVLSKATPVTDLAFLLSDMLAFDDTQRPTATQCLQHSCFKSVQSSRTEPTTFTQTGKRSREKWTRIRGRLFGIIDWLMSSIVRCN